MANNATQGQKPSDRDQLTNQLDNLEIDSKKKSKYVPPHLRGRKPQQQQPQQEVTAEPANQHPKPAAPPSNWAPSSYVQPEPTNAVGRRFPRSSPGVDGDYDRPSKHHDKQLEAELFGKSKVNSGINFDKYDDIPVTASGNDVPAPIESFESGNFHPLLTNVFRLSNFTKPTPIQKHAFSIVQSGRDLMACAQTGSGKTGAFLIPIISRMLASGPSAPSNGGGRSRIGIRQAFPKAIILAPTRELAQQIFDDARTFTYKSWIRPAVIYGGVPISGQMAQIDRGCDLLVATPGRLTDILMRGKVCLSMVDFLVLDEADRMLDMGFEVQIRKIVLESGMRDPEEGRNTLMFSATFPKDIQELAREFLNDYIFVTVGKVGASSENIKQRIEYVQDSEKYSLLRDLLDKDAQSGGLVLVFVETKMKADRLDQDLYQAGVRCCAIHGDRTQEERTAALRLFREGSVNVLIATSVASRGLDIPNVTHVINYELPGDMNDYVHRIGRTGRAGNIGRATTFFTDANRNCAADLVKILQDAKQEVPSWLHAMSVTSNAPPSGPSRSRYHQSSGSRYGGSGQGQQFGSARFNSPTPHHASGSTTGRYQSGGGGHAPSNRSYGSWD